MSNTTNTMYVGSPARADRLQTAIQLFGMLPILILLCIGFELLSGRFATLVNLSIVMQQAAINTTLASGMTFVILTGGIDLSVGSIVAASAMVSVLSSLIPGWGYLGIPAGLGISLLCGLANGLLVAVVKLPPFIATLGSLTAVRGLARLIGNDSTVFNTSMPFAFIGNGSLFGVPWLVIIAFAGILVSWLILKKTVLGTYIYAIGGNEDAARLAGIRVAAVLVFVYGLSGLFAGLGGVLSAARLYAANGLQLGQA